jgi:N-acetyl-anhydromuramyl-L-alanine amidase AmpD
LNIINSNLQFRSLSYGNHPDTIVLHHAEASHCTIQDIHQWHLNNGWAGCGYHYLVRKDGSIYTGRPENAIGAHCPSENTHSIGICAEGEYMHEAMPQVQKQSLIELGIYIKNKYGINRVGGHKEFYSTDCPGTN